MLLGKGVTRSDQNSTQASSLNSMLDSSCTVSTLKRNKHTKLKVLTNPITISFSGFQYGKRSVTEQSSNISEDKRHSTKQKENGDQQSHNFYPVSSSINIKICI